jgi:hypothetical protein
MQRKNSLLSFHNSSQKRSHRNAMAMIMAIAAIVVVATIMALSMAMTTETTKRTSDLYLYEQSILLSKSAAEYALLLVAQNQPCTDLNTTFTQDTFYTIDIGISYIYDSVAPCTANGGALYTTVATPEQNGSVLLDVTVSVTDATVTTEPIRYFRRTIQKL